MTTTPVTVELIDHVSTHIGHAPDIDDQLVVLELHGVNGHVQRVGISSCAAYELRDQILRTLEAAIDVFDEDDDAWPDDPR